MIDYSKLRYLGKEAAGPRTNRLSKGDVLILGTIDPEKLATSKDPLLQDLVKITYSALLEEFMEVGDKVVAYGENSEEHTDELIPLLDKFAHMARLLGEVDNHNARN